MSEFGNTSKPLGQQGADAANKAADTVKDGIGAAQKTANQALDKMSNKADEARSQVAPAMDKVSDQAQKLVQQGSEALHGTTQMVKDKAGQASDLAVDYTKGEPMKALLIAAATGALLMGFVTMLARSRD